MYDSIVSFIRKKTGCGAEVTRKEVKGAFDEFAFEYETGTFTSVDDKEVEDKDGKKVTKRVTTHGYYLRGSNIRCRSLSAVLLCMLRKEGWRGPHVCHMMCIQCASCWMPEAGARRLC